MAALPTISTLGEGHDTYRRDLGALSVEELLRLSREAVGELRKRGVVRTGDARAGDYAEWLVMNVTGRHCALRRAVRRPPDDAAPDRGRQGRGTLAGARARLDRLRH